MSQLDEIKNIMNNIRVACLGDPMKLEIAIANYEQLIVVMQKYEKANFFYLHACTFAHCVCSPYDDSG